jgi:hypothetical protein
VDRAGLKKSKLSQYRKARREIVSGAGKSIARPLHHAGRECGSHHV